MPSQNKLSLVKQYEIWNHYKLNGKSFTWYAKKYKVTPQTINNYITKFLNKRNDTKTKATDKEH